MPENPRVFPSAYPKGGYQEGLSLRDLFAFGAMVGHIVCGNSSIGTPEMIADWSYAQADYMLAQREKGGGDA